MSSLSVCDESGVLWLIGGTNGLMIGPVIVVVVFTTVVINTVVVVVVVLLALTVGGSKLPLKFNINVYDL